MVELTVTNGHGAGNDYYTAGSKPPPWNDAGHTIPTGMSPTEAQAEYLNWRVHLKPVYQKVEGVYRKIDGHRSVTRSDTGDVLHMVSDRYSEFQNRELAKIAEDIIGAGNAHVEVVGDLGGGRVVYMLVRTPDADYEIREGHQHKRYMWVGSSHDGSLPTTILQTDFKVTCANMFASMFRAANSTIKVKHTRNNQQRLNNAVRALRASMTYSERLQHVFRAMEETPYSRQQMNALALRIVGGQGWKKMMEAMGTNEADAAAPPVDLQNQTGAAILSDMLEDTKQRNVVVPEDFLSAQAQRNIATLDMLFRNPEQGNRGQTAYDAINAVTDYCTNERTTKNTNRNSAAENNLASNLYGGSANLGRRALNLILADTGLADRL